MYLELVNILAKQTASRQRIPSAYQEVAYISSNYDAYIDTGIVFTKDMQMEIMSSIQEYSAWGTGIVGDELTICSNINGTMYLTMSNSVSIGNVVNNITWSEYIFNDVNHQLVNKFGTPLYTFTNAENFNGRETMGLFVTHQNGYLYPAKGAISYFRIRKHTGELLCDYVPCYRKSDNVAGMYDTVTGQFMPSITNTPFSTGPVVQ